MTKLSWKHNNFWAISSFPSPVIYAHHAQEGIVLLEDLGDDLLETVAQRSDETHVAQLYKQAVDLLLTMRRATMKVNSGCRAFQLAFDEEKLMQEMDFFMTHFVRGLCRKDRQWQRWRT